MAELVNDFFSIYSNVPTNFGEFIPYISSLIIQLFLVLGVFRTVAAIVSAAISIGGKK